ncbi:inorganic pyrophosphatase [Colletotrichum orchidophilum]|uniref:inorganic diphosphatase n=1 Tax=Colletotrichum orchidophilum TaxID=1209926 RepID=A0A1G4BK23_9PEZI|nr:inorganic pyrophosphatase [Colletotrichum orchidophilum]OHF01789.1 inorganic pyrophosphatase [Colletotrichum orchidophilum]
MLNRCVLAVVALSTLSDAASTSPRIFNYSALSLREDWRIWLEKDGDPISFWHDVPVWPDESNKQVVNLVVEVPRWQDGKIELKRNEPLNPIVHDSLNGAPRYVENVWPHKSYPFIYGSIPQTWESPNYNHSFTRLLGDNDPVDLFDIGQDRGYVGQVKQVKILGGLALADDNETDWKILGIDVKDPMASIINYVEKYRPGTIKTFRDWWAHYKVARGDPVINIIGDWYQNVTYMQSVIEESHTTWAELIRGEVDSNEINYNQTSRPDVENSFLNKSSTTARFNIPAESRVDPAAPRPEKAERWYYLDSDSNLIVVPETQRTFLNRQQA